MSYQSKSDAVLGVQLKVQEVCVKLGDAQLVSVSGLVATIQLGEAIAEVRAALHLDDSAGTVAPVAAANRAISGSTVALTLAAALTAADSIVLKYVIAE